MDEAKKSGNYLEIAKASAPNSEYWQNSANTGSFMDWQDAIDEVKTSWDTLVYKIGAKWL